MSPTWMKSPFSVEVHRGFKYALHTLNVSTDKPLTFSESTPEHKRHKHTTTNLSQKQTLLKTVLSLHFTCASIWHRLSSTEPYWRAQHKTPRWISWRFSGSGIRLHPVDLLDVCGRSRIILFASAMFPPVISCSGVNNRRLPSWPCW